jgi:protein-L-isoaspartate O-methyltransferase
MITQTGIASGMRVLDVGSGGYNAALLPLTLRAVAHGLWVAEPGRGWAASR